MPWIHCLTDVHLGILSKGEITGYSQGNIVLAEYLPSRQNASGVFSGDLSFCHLYIVTSNLRI